MLIIKPKQLAINIVAFVSVLLFGLFIYNKYFAENEQVIDNNAYCQAVSDPACYSPEDQKRYFPE